MIYFYFQSLQTLLVPVYWCHSGSLPLTASTNVDANFTDAEFTDAGSKYLTALWQATKKQQQLSLAQLINNKIMRAIVWCLPPIHFATAFLYQTVW